MALLVAINAKYVHTSLSVRCLKKMAGESAEIFECSINDSITNVCEEIYKTGHKHILFSCYLWNVEMVLKICEMLKKADENILITLGGPEVSFDAEKMMENKNIDHIICGEGETGIKKFIENPPQRGIYDFGVLEDLSELGFVYEKEELLKLSGRLIYYETSRGCPYSCAFCLSSSSKGVRFLPLERVKEDILKFIDAKTPLVKFVDRTFNADNKRAVLIVEFIKKHSKNTSFHFEVKAESMSDELIKSLVSAREGLFQLEIGVQSTNPETLLKINRRENFDKLKEVVKKLSKNPGVHLHLDLIAGLPDESLEVFKKSFNDCYGLRPHDLQLGFLKKLKGAKITDADGLFQSFAPYEIIKTSAMSYDDIILLKQVCAVLDKLYNSGAFSNTLELLEKSYTDAFSMFEEIASFFDFTKSISQKRVYEVLYNFSIKKYGNDYLKNALIYDFCLLNKDYLSFMKDMPDLKNETFEFLKDDEKTKKFFPQYLNLKPTQRFKKLRFEKIGDKIFAFDSQNKKACDVTEHF